MKKDTNSQRTHPAPAARDTAPAGRRSTVALVLSSTLIVLLYSILIWLTTGADPSLDLDMVGGYRIYGVDDAWRFYITQAAWFNPQYYSWDFVLPVALLVDSIVPFLADGDILSTRFLLITRALLVLFFITQSCRILGAPLWASLSGAMTVTLMPLFIFTSTSLYGESLLTVFLAGAIYFHVRRNEKTSILLFSLMPLIRPEGLFYMAPMALNALINRKFSHFVLLGLPGFIYLIYLSATLPELGYLIEHRLEWRRIYRLYTEIAQVAEPGEPVWVLSLFNIFWVLGAAVALLLHPYRRLWFLWAGSFGWFLYYLIWSSLQMADYQPRYFVSVTPVFGIGFGLFAYHVHSFFLRTSRARWLAPIVAVLVISIVLEHFLQVDALKYRLGGDRRWPVAGLHAITDGRIKDHSEDRQARGRIAQLTAHLAKEEDQFEFLFVADARLFRHLSPSALEPHIRVVWMESTPAMALHIKEGRFFSAHPYDRMYSYFELHPGPESADGAGIYIGNLDEFGWPAAYRAGEYGLYGVGYTETHDSIQKMIDRTRR